MPKPLKKAATKSAKGDRARQLLEQHIGLAADTGIIDPKGQFVPDPPGPSIMEPALSEQLRAHMRALGTKGGKVSGAKRMQMPEAKRKAIAKKGAAARWGKKPG